MSRALAVRPPAALSRWDRILLAIAPRWGLRRIRARAAAADLARHYEAAASGRRTDGWTRAGGDANAANRRDLPTLRDLSRDIRRNNSWARRAVRVIGNNTVGWGIKGKAAESTPRGVRTEANRIWNQWTRSSACDHDGRLAFAGLQRLVIDTVVDSGAAIILRVRNVDDERLPVPLRVRVLEPDYIDLSKDGPVRGGGGNVIVQGIELDRSGQRVAYWLFRQHPGATGAAGMIDPRGLESVRVPAEDVIHVYDIERAGGLHGIPWLTAVIPRLNDLGDYDDAKLMQAKIAAALAGFIHDIDGFGATMGEVGTLGAASTPLEDQLVEEIEPGTLIKLPAGKNITFSQPPSASDHAPFTASQLRAIAAGLDVTYEDMTGDYSQVNYSSARMARLSHYQAVYHWRWNMLIPQFCDGVWGWVVGFAAEENGWDRTPDAEWTEPPMPMLDPDKEGRATSSQVRSGMKTLFQVIREQGLDPEEHLAEIAAANAKLDELGIWLDSDPRRTSAAGLTQASVGGVAPAGDVEEDASAATNGSANGFAQDDDEDASDAELQ